MRLRATRRGILALILGLTASLALLTSVLGFSEEGRLWFVDPEDGQPYYAEGVSTVDFDLVGALAECAGMNPQAVNSLQVYTQLVDSNKLADGKYSLCGRTLPDPPESTQVCGGQQLLRTWPLPDAAQEGAGCFTSRFGPFAPFFHFAHDTPTELGALRSWAMGETTTLRARADFAWGGDPINPVINATCTYTPTVTIDTGDVEAGSTQAFGIYLHALGDHWSEKDCLSQLDAAGEPWGTTTNDPRFPGCSTNAPLNEFGPSNANTNRTEQGVRAIYAALVERSQTKEQETLYYPIPIDAHGGHLSQAISEFVHTWPTSDPTEQQDYPMHRREKAAEIKQWCAVTRANDPTYARVRWFNFLPVLIRSVRLRQ